MDQIWKGSLPGHCVRIKSSSRLDSRSAALLILLLPQPTAVDCRGLVPPKSGVLTLCVCVCTCTFNRQRLLLNIVHSCVCVCLQTMYFTEGLRSEGVALGTLTHKTKGTPAANMSECGVCLSSRTHTYARTHLISFDFCPFFAKKLSLQRKTQREHSGTS